MADTTPRHNQACVSLGILMDDATTGADNGLQAAADGKWLTAVRKNMYMNEAYRWIVTEFVNRYGIGLASEKLQGLIAAATQTYATLGQALPADYMYPVTLQDGVNLDSAMLTKRASLEDDFMPSLTNFYVIEKNKLYNYKRTAGVLAVSFTGIGLLYYLKADRIDSSGVDVAANTAPDTVVDRWAIDACVLYAAGRACFDKSIIDSAPEFMDKGNRFMAQSLMKLPPLQSA